MLQRNRRTLALPAFALIAALGLAGCSFTTEPKPAATASAATPAPAASGTGAATGGAENSAAVVDFDGLIAAFGDAGLIDPAARGALSTDGLATKAYVWRDASGAYLELYYIDAATASPEVLANQELARAEHYVKFGDFQIPIDDVRGPFMISYSSSADPAAAQAVWEKATTGLE